MAVSLVITAVGSKRIPINLWFFKPEKRIYSEWGEYWIDIWDKRVVFKHFIKNIFKYIKILLNILKFT